MKSDKASFGKETAPLSCCIHILNQPFQRWLPTNLFPLTPGQAPASNLRTFVLCTRSAPNFGPKPDFQPFSPDQFAVWALAASGNCSMRFGGGRSQHQWFTLEPLVSRECRCLQQMGIFPAADSYPWSLPLQGARGMNTSLPISQGQRHVSFQPTQRNSATHAKYHPRCCEHQRRWSDPLMAEVTSTAKGPAPEERLYGNRRHGKGKRQHPCRQHISASSQHHVLHGR